MSIDWEVVFMVVGFTLASYSVIGNDVMQTLGTFLSSNSRRPWWVLWLFAGSILLIVIINGYMNYNGSPAYGRLEKFPLPDPFAWYYILPPLILLVLTRFGFPVSTTFIILSLFGSKNIGDMILKSLLGYVVAFFAAIFLYYFISKKVEKRFIETDIKKDDMRWTALQWVSTGFLWSQWLVQDLANIFVYMPRQIDIQTLVFCLAVLLGLLGYIFYKGGGEIQKIITSKTNTNDIRSATIIDFVFGIIMLVFKDMSNMPMSTTWIFIGLLAGREFALRWQLYNRNIRPIRDEMLRDVGKASAGLVVSVLLVMLIKFLSGEPVPFID